MFSSDYVRSVSQIDSLLHVNLGSASDARENLILVFSTFIVRFGFSFNLFLHFELNRVVLFYLIELFSYS